MFRAMIVTSIAGREGGKSFTWVVFETGGICRKKISQGPKTTPILTSIKVIPEAARNTHICLDDTFYTVAT